MICEVCREKHADIVFKTVTGNQVATKAMCMSCAHAMQQDMIKMFMSMGLQQGQARAEQQEAEKEQAPAMPRFICTNCERPFDRLDEHTMAGCAVCYEALGSELAGLFHMDREDAQEDHQEGRAPAAESADAGHESEAQDLRFSLMEAVVREDFEEAARLRDLLAQEGAQGGTA
jgi:protein arginine kinase activator